MSSSFVLAYERGRLEIDPDTGRLCCHLCGAWWVNLAQHALLKHGVSASEYRELAGLNRTTRLMSASRREQIRKAALPLIERLRAAGKLRRWNEDPEKFARDKAAAVAVIREQGLTPEARSKHRREKLAPEVRAGMAERTRQRNLSGELRAAPEAIAAGLRRHYQEDPELRTCERCAQSYPADHTAARYCLPCREAHQREYQRDWKRRARGLDPAECGPWNRKCAHCGQTFTAHRSREKYCLPCRPEVAKEQRPAGKRG